MQQYLTEQDLSVEKQIDICSCGSSSVKIWHKSKLLNNKLRKKLNVEKI